jgi:hypothetical protein
MYNGKKFPAIMVDVNNLDAIRIWHDANFGEACQVEIVDRPIQWFARCEPRTDTTNKMLKISTDTMEEHIYGTYGTLFKVGNDIFHVAGADTIEEAFKLLLRSVR